MLTITAERRLNDYAARPLSQMLAKPVDCRRRGVSSIALKRRSPL